jgi:2-phosphosulfolactate phosphatase
MYYEQAEFEVRCEWGLAGIANLAPSSDVVIIVDVLSFSTCVEIAVSRGAIIYPYLWKDFASEEFAERVGAVLATSRRSATGYSLSPKSLAAIPPGTKLVLPSPNGSTLTLASGDKPTVAGCFRNAGTVASTAQQLGRRILVVPAGERWPDGPLRPAVEDLLGAGAIIKQLRGSKSPEALVAENAFVSVEHDVTATLRACGSGKELIERGFGEDVALAAQVDVSDCAPVLGDGAFRKGK